MFCHLFLPVCIDGHFSRTAIVDFDYRLPVGATILPFSVCQLVLFCVRGKRNEVRRFPQFPSTPGRASVALGWAFMALGMRLHRSRVSLHGESGVSLYGGSGGSLHGGSGVSLHGGVRGEPPRGVRGEPPREVRGEPPRWVRGKPPRGDRGEPPRFQSEPTCSPGWDCCPSTWKWNGNGKRHRYLGRFFSERFPLVHRAVVSLTFVRLLANKRTEVRL
jgi:hypothetical protein